MLKPDSLRAALVAALPDLARDPDKLSIFIDRGRVVSRISAEPNFPAAGFEYRYRLNAILLDFTGHPDAVMVALILWLQVNQPDLLLNHQTGDNAIAFEADIVDSTTVDLSIEIELSESVRATARDDGGYDLVHLPEPPAIPEFEGVPRWTGLERIYLGGELIAGEED